VLPAQAFHATPTPTANSPNVDKKVAGPRWDHRRRGAAV